MFKQGNSSNKQKLKSFFFQQILQKNMSQFLSYYFEANKKNIDSSKNDTSYY